MKLPLLVMVFAVAFAGTAAASGYTDLNVGIDARNNGNNDLALDHLTSAIAAHDLPPQLLPLAHLVRCELYTGTKKLDLAIAECTTALALHPNWYEAYLIRHDAYVLKGDQEHALPDISAAIALRPWQKAAYLSRAVYYAKKQDYDAAIADISYALVLEPDIATVYLFRGSLYRLKNDLDRALADQNKAIALDGTAPSGYFERAATYRERGDLDRAIGDFSAGLAIAPNQPDARLRLGIAQWEKGLVSAALANITAAAGAMPANAYPLLWRTIVRVATHTADDDLRQSAGKIDAVKWPAPVVAYFLGDKTAEQTMASAATGDPATQAGRVCEAQFYIGEWRLLHGEPDPARALLQTAATTCPVRFIERDAAAAELKRKS